MPKSKGFYTETISYKYIIEHDGSLSYDDIKAIAHIAREYIEVQNDGSFNAKELADHLVNEHDATEPEKIVDAIKSIKSDGSEFQSWTSDAMDLD